MKVVSLQESGYGVEEDEVRMDEAPSPRDIPGQFCP